MAVQAFLFGQHLSDGFNLPSDHGFTVCEGARFSGDLRLARRIMAQNGFHPHNPTDPFCNVFTDGRSTFRAEGNTRCGLLGHSAGYQVLRQVWGA